MERTRLTGRTHFRALPQQTYRDVAGVVQETMTIGTNKVNEFRFQYARRGLQYFYSDAPGGSNVASNIAGFGFVGREPYSYIQRVEERYQFTDNFSWTIGRHDTKFGADFNYLPLTATFTVNYGGVYNFSSSCRPRSLVSPRSFPSFTGLQAFGLGIPSTLVQGIGNPKDSFSNKPLGVFWQDSFRVRQISRLIWASATTSSSRPTSAQPDRDWLSPPTTNWACRKESRLTTTIFSRASA